MYWRNQTGTPCRIVRDDPIAEILPRAACPSLGTTAARGFCFKTGWRCYANRLVWHRSSTDRATCLERRVQCGFDSRRCYYFLACLVTRRLAAFNTAVLVQVIGLVSS